MNSFLNQCVILKSLKEIIVIVQSNDFKQQVNNIPKYCMFVGYLEE